MLALDIASHQMHIPATSTQHWSQWSSPPNVASPHTPYQVPYPFHSSRHPIVPPTPAYPSSGATFGTWSAARYAYDSGSEAGSPLSSSPVLGSPAPSVPTRFPTPAAAVAASHSRPLVHAKPSAHVVAPISPAAPTSTVHAFNLSTLEPLDASDDPYPVSMADLVYAKEDVEYSGMSYHFALPNTDAAESSSGRPSRRNSPSDSEDAASSGVHRRRPKVKLHYCPTCEKAFPRPSGLKTHMNSHSGEKPFPCPVENCTKSFTVRSNAKRHLRTHGIYPSTSRSPSANPTVDFEKPVVAEEITDAHSHFGRKMRVRWFSDRHERRDDIKDRERSADSMERSRACNTQSPPYMNVSRTASHLPSLAPRVSAPSISCALGGAMP